MLLLSFFVRSSSGDAIYEVTATNDGRLRYSCTCEAGMIGTLCKHRMSLLDGDVTKCIDASAADVERLRDAVQASPLAGPLRRLAELEAESARVKAEISRTKKQLARMMDDGCT